MNAFITPFSGTVARPALNSRPLTSRPNSATPFFASSAFGSPLPTRAVLPTPFNPTPATSRNTPRMEVTIVVGENEPVESAIRRFKKDVSKSGHLFELRRRRYFETNTEKRIRKAAAARRKARMARNEKRKNSSRIRSQNGSPVSNASSSPSPVASSTITSASAPMTAPLTAPAAATAASAPQ